MFSGVSAIQRVEGNPWGPMEARGPGSRIGWWAVLEKLPYGNVQRRSILKGRRDMNLKQVSEISDLLCTPDVGPGIFECPLWLPFEAT